MSANDFDGKVHYLKCVSDLNQRYHQRMQWWWDLADKVVKIIVCSLAVAALALVLTHGEHKTAELWVAIFSAAAAVALNVIPLGERAAFYGELFRGWSDLQTDAAQLALRSNHLGPDDKVHDHFAERLSELIAKQHQLNAEEPAPWRWLLNECQEDQNESAWGKGVRTYQQVEEERKKRTQSNPLSCAVAAGPE